MTSQERHALGNRLANAFANFSPPIDAPRLSAIFECLSSEDPEEVLRAYERTRGVAMPEHIFSELVAHVHKCGAHTSRQSNARHDHLVLSFGIPWKKNIT